MSAIRRPGFWQPFFLGAAVFNTAVGLPLLAMPTLFYSITALGEPGQYLEARIIGWLILLFGAIYVLIAKASETPFALIILMGTGKLGVVAMILIYWLDGALNTLGALLGLLDLLWALGFLYVALFAPISTHAIDYEVDAAS